MTHKQLDIAVSSSNPVILTVIDQYATIFVLVIRVFSVSQIPASLNSDR